MRNIVIWLTFSFIITIFCKTFIDYCIIDKPWLVVIELVYEASFAIFLGIIAAFVYEKIQIDRKKKDFEENTKHLYGKYQVYNWPNSEKKDNQFKLNTGLRVEIIKSDKPLHLHINQEGDDEKNNKMISDISLDMSSYQFGSGFYKHTLADKRDVGNIQLHFVERNIINVDKSYSENNNGVYNLIYEKWQWRKKTDNI